MRVGLVTDAWFPQKNGVVTTLERAALELDPAVCRAYAMQFSWRRCAAMFLENLAPIRCDAVRAS